MEKKQQIAVPRQKVVSIVCSIKIEQTQAYCIILHSRCRQEVRRMLDYKLSNTKLNIP